MTTSLVILFIFAFIISAVKAGKNKTKYKPYKKYENIQKPKEYYYKDIYQDIGKNNPSYNQESNYEKERKKGKNNISKKEKGDKYETYVANFFREQGYFVWEHGKEKGVKDSGVDLFIKKENKIYFVQCKDWEKWKLNHNTVQAIQTKIRNFLKQEDGIRKLSNGYTQKILYVTSKKCLTAGAYKYIEENNDILEYQVIPIGA